MQRLKWREEFEVGVQRLDRQHQEFGAIPIRTDHEYNQYLNRRGVS